MNAISRNITGTAMVIIGLIMAVFFFYESWVMLIYGGLILALGIYILFNKKEDDIEKIKER